MLPEFVGKYPQYEKVGLRDLCSQIHGVYKANDIARLTTEMYLSNMEPAMRPADAWAKLAHREIERVDIRTPAFVENRSVAQRIEQRCPVSESARRRQRALPHR